MRTLEFPSEGRDGLRGARVRHRAAGAVAVALVAALLDSCHGGAEQGSGGLEPTPAATAATLPAGASSSSVSGVWEGWYDCAQGLTGLTLTITGTDDEPEGLVARFSFYPVPGNPEVPPGVFTMRGERVEDQLTLRPDEWVQRPGSYVMVGLDAELSGDGAAAPAVISGTVQEQSCSTFEVGVLRPDPSPPDEPAVNDAIAGTWEGSYQCQQVRRGLRLVATPARDGRFEATFDFFPLPGEQDSETGTFAMVGSYSQVGLLAEPDYWIDRPGDYVMVGLSADLSDRRPERLEGDVDGPGCSTYTLDRVSDRWSPPSGKLGERP